MAIEIGQNWPRWPKWVIPLSPEPLMVWSMNKQVSIVINSYQSDLTNISSPKSVKLAKMGHILLVKILYGRRNGATANMLAFKT